MVEFDEDPSAQVCVCRCPEKSVSAITIRKDRSGYIFFEVVVDRGPTPSALSGKFSSMISAKDAVRRYFNGMSETVAARRENFAKDREERKAAQNAAKPDPEGR